ncbi:zf-TFIIB domain-containing protein [Sporichthya sp.]|nr:zf-TFIIB domain-containing protein [Sporichthya sp.]MBA3745142.1 zf-TFIIB domain-containing protein [Sporichthya sp.]
MRVLTCPKCTADMRSYERNGATIDHCEKKKRTSFLSELFD